MFVMKEPEGQSKGIIILTHNERHLLTTAPRTLRLLLDKIKEEYFLGMHSGGYQKHMIDVPYVDFYMSAAGNMRVPDTWNKPHIKMSSREFIPVCFQPNLHIHKIWDILYITRPILQKRIDHFFLVMKRVLEKRPHTKILLIVSDTQIKRAGYSYLNLYKDYHLIFTEEQKKQLEILHLKSKKTNFPLSPSEIASYYNQSRIFTLFSDREGESRVIAEALLCGVPIVAKSYLAGGGRDYLNAENSRLFTSDEEACDAFCSLLDDPISISPKMIDEIAVQTREDYTVQKLTEELRDLYSAKGLPFDGQLYMDGLTRRLPSHTQNIDRSLTLPLSDNIKNYSSLYIFLSSLNRNKARRPFFLCIGDIQFSIRNMLKRIYAFIRAFP
ncbi:MAG: glycosyltransferase [Alphaproteobacteria bacterium]|jgi:glycosyltransferase involved in cell wall biosynthesis|nr:glycosyltransferase [Alphaproteobacteria bacterium]MDP7222675.1 glycosyltransferase [Alphaproteobacteria bacterium]